MHSRFDGNMANIIFFFWDDERRSALFCCVYASLLNSFVSASYFVKWKFVVVEICKEETSV